MRSNIKRPHYSSQAPQGRRRLSTVQLIVAIAVLVVIAAVTVPRVISAINHAHNPQTLTVEQELSDIEHGLRLYKQDNGVYPTNEQGLLALVIKPSRVPVPAHWQIGGYVERLPRDPWGHPYQYRLSEGGNSVDVFSFGPAGPDGEGEGAVRNRH